VAPDSSEKSQRKAARLPRFQFLTSAIDLEGCPADAVPEVALAGRSNAGKSSFINALASEKIARVSSAPGKTNLLNFYQGSTGYRLVDMPGYGYAKRGGGEVFAWSQMIEPYLAARGNLAGLLILLDVRRPWAIEERELVRWLQPLGIPAAALLTKADKVTRSECAQARDRALRDSGLANVFATSALKRSGLAELEDFVFREWVRGRLGGSRSERK
jgi:GTP-binding protein